MADQTREWYREVWDPSIEELPWAQGTLDDVEFLSTVVDLSRPRRILDLACGFGRHALELAHRGHTVVGVDVAPSLIERAEELRGPDEREPTFICADIRDLSFVREFDLVLNLWEGAIGYLESEEENKKIFSVVARALTAAGDHVAGPLINADFARGHFPLCRWERNDQMLLRTELQWFEETSEIQDTAWWLPVGAETGWPTIEPRVARYRVYSPHELSDHLRAVGMVPVAVYSHPDQTPGATPEDFEFWLHSRKD